jgi:2-isopropylmalate synthase
VISQQIFPSSQLLSEITGVTVQPNKAIVGRNAFAHEAGIHQDGMIKNSLTYEIMTPQSVGVTGTRLVLGKHSGRHALGLRCEELGFRLDRRELENVYQQFLGLADNHKVVDDRQLLELITRFRTLPSDVAEATSEGSRNIEADPVKDTLPSQFPLAYLAKGLVPNGEGVAFPSKDEHDGEQQEDYLWGV